MREAIREHAMRVAIRGQTEGHQRACNEGDHQRGKLRATRPGRGKARCSWRTHR